MNGKATKEEIEKFIAEYNKRIRWNREIREDMEKTDEDIVSENENVRFTIDYWLNTKEISVEDNGQENTDTIDTGDSSIYTCVENDGRIVVEMQAYNLTECHSLTYFVTINENEKDYKKRLIGMIKGNVRDSIERDCDEIEKLYNRREGFIRLERVLDNIQNT